MKSKELKRKRTFVLKMDRDEEILSSIALFCTENKIQGGTIQGIGTLSSAKIYCVNNNNTFLSYPEGTITLDKPLELVSALGNISIDDAGKPIVHLHVTLTFRDSFAGAFGNPGALITKSGHLVEGKISFAGEFFITETEKLVKKQDGPLKQFSL